MRFRLTDGDTRLEALAVILILIGGIGGAYYLSLSRNPWAVCSKCHGKPRTQGWVFSRAHRICPKCQGTGQQLRLGRRVFGMGPPANPSP